MKAVVKNTIGARIKARRIELGYTQEQFAEVMNTTKGTICKYERDAIDIKNSALVELAFQLNLSVGYLVNGEESVNMEEKELLNIFRSIESNELKIALIAQAKVLAQVEMSFLDTK